MELNYTNFKEKNIKNLNKIMQDNQTTLYGKKYHFNQIHSADEYRTLVPFTTYEDVEPYIKKMMDGKTDILTVYPVIDYSRSSGSVGQSKFFPVTEEALKRYDKHPEIYKNTIFNSLSGKRLFISQFRTKPWERTQEPKVFSEIYYRGLVEQGFLKSNDYAGGTELLFQKNNGNNLYAKVWVSFLIEDISLIESIFMYDVLLFFKYMEKHWQEILRDMELCIIPEERNISNDVKEILLYKKIDTQRLEKVKNECEKGFNNIALRLWSNIRLISGVSHPSFSAEDSILKGYIGDVSRHYFSYCCSECMLGTCLKENDYGFVLLPDSGFFEFLPYIADNDTAHKMNLEDELSVDSLQTCLPEEVEPGKYYELIITNFNGLYRYRLGDIVRIRGVEKGALWMEFSFRRNQVLNLAGEKITVTMIEQAVQEIQNNNIQLYCVGLTKYAVPGKYLLAVALNEDTTRIDKQKLTKEFDTNLSKMNWDYKDLRSLGSIAEPEVIIMSHNQYTKMLEQTGMLGGQTKPRHIAHKGVLEEYL